MIRVAGLRKRFGDNVVLKSIDLDIAEGSVTALIGPSGSGKSTLLRCVNLLEMPQASRIAVPPLSNTFISLVKDTSLAAAITVPELFRAGQRIVATSYEPLIIYVQVALIYLVVSSVLSSLQAHVEKRFSRYGGYIEAAS